LESAARFGSMKKLLFILVLCASSNVSAQISLPNIQVSDFPDPVINTQIDIGMVLRNPVGTQTSSPSSQRPATSFVYASSKTRTRTNLQNITSRWRKLNPAHGDQLEQIFSSTDVIGTVGGVMEQFGLQRNNVAHAYALYWVVYWGLANNAHATPSAEAMQSVAAQAEQSFSAAPQFATMNESEKQAAAEELMVLAAILDAASEQSKSDPTVAAQFVKAALEGSRKSGLDLDKMTLTEGGFVPAKPRKRSDASDVMAGEEKALASATPFGSPCQFTKCT
jgi:hypothetical protein